MAFCFCWRLCCCSCDCLEPPDDWNIETECRPGERGAGFLYKRGKGAAVWSKRYFAITDTKLIYYTEQDRLIAKGEIVLAGSTAKVSSTRANAKKKFYFTVTHPECGMREFYAKSNNRRVQWIDKLNDLSGLLMNSAAFGKLFKQGGLSKNVWQERWCVAAGRYLDYFDNATDNQAKGSIDLLNSKTREFATKDQKFCFEIVGTLPGKKGLKKYIFATEKEPDRKKWLEALVKASTYRPFQYGPGAGAGGEGAAGPTGNPMLKDEDDNESSGAAAAAARPSVNRPPEKKGYLQKKSPALLKGWQKRFFVLKNPGELFYYDSEQDFDNNMQPKGDIQIAELLPGGKAVEVTGCELVLHVPGKSIPLRASTAEEAQDWAKLIEAWLNHLSNLD